MKKRELDRKRQEKTERELAERRKEIERAKSAEVEEKRAAEARKVKAEAAEKGQVERAKNEAEALRRETEAKDADKRAQEAVSAAQTAKAAEAQQSAQATQELPPTIVHSAPLKSKHPTSDKSQVDSGKEAEHQRYQAIHQSLKDLRRFMMAQAKGNPVLKKRMGDMRREIKKCVGQLTEGKGANRGPVIIRITMESTSRY